MSGIWSEFVYFWEAYLVPSVDILLPLGILVVGWLVALVVKVLIQRLLHRTELDDKFARLILGEKTAARIRPEVWISKGVYYLLMLFVLVAFFEGVGLTLVTQPLNQLLVQIFVFMPVLLSAGLLLLLAWIVARLLRTLVVRVLSAARLEERLGGGDQEGAAEHMSIPETVGNGVYWLVFLVFLPAILGALGLEGLLAPVREMVSEAMSFIPNLLAGGLILAAGWFGARIVQRIAVNLLAAGNLDRVGKDSGLDAVLGEKPISGLIGRALYYAVFLLAAIAALDALQFEVISQPASAMLGRIFDALPAIFTAALVLLVAYLLGRLIQGMVVALLVRAGFDKLMERLGLGPAEGASGRSPAAWVGHLALVAILLFAAIEAAALLGFAGMQTLLVEFTRFAGQVVMGLVIFVLGLYLANLIGEIVERKDIVQSKLVALGARLVVLILATAMALRQMGIANEIINAAFGLLLGGIAVAVALAFGLGCRDLAGRTVEGWLGRLEEPKESEPEGEEQAQ
ncbi:MAG: mechanosensitive ion channel [Candidatus Latescibacteria bacterium]|nr:mechanosensitive ion channel [Candidatus Latescibacterota bacterium]